jgi:hypothetical protein
VFMFGKWTEYNLPSQEEISTWPYNCLLLLSYLYAYSTKRGIESKQKGTSPQHNSRYPFFFYPHSIPFSSFLCFTNPQSVFIMFYRCIVYMCDMCFCSSCTYAYVFIYLHMVIFNIAIGNGPWK